MASHLSLDLIPATDSLDRNSSQSRTPDSQRAISFFLPMDGNIWKVCSIMPRAMQQGMKNMFIRASVAIMAWVKIFESEVLSYR